MVLLISLPWTNITSRDGDEDVQFLLIFISNLDRYGGGVLSDEWDTKRGSVTVFVVAVGGY